MTDNVEESFFREAEYKTVRLADMHPAEYNPRYDLQPGDIKYDNLKSSVVKNGLLQPIVYNPVTGNIVGGNQRYKILKELGAEEVICAVIRYETLEEEMAACIALNKAHGQWENALLVQLFQTMGEDLDYNTMGFDKEEVDHLISGLEELGDSAIFDETQEPEKKSPMVKCPNCKKKFEEGLYRVKDN